MKEVIIFMKQIKIKCPYCHAKATLRPASVVYGPNKRAQGKYLYICDRWPACDAYVSAHDHTHLPMGTLANGDLREIFGRPKLYLFSAIKLLLLPIVMMLPLCLVFPASDLLPV